MPPFMRRHHTRNSSQTSSVSASSATTTPPAAVYIGKKGGHARSSSNSSLASCDPTSTSSSVGSAGLESRSLNHHRASTMSPMLTTTATATATTATAGDLGSLKCVSSSTSLHSHSRSSSSSLNLVHAGEVIASTGLLRGKKKDFVVLTRNELLRFKTRSKAADMFPTLNPIQRHPSNASSLSSTNTIAESAVPSLPLESTICALDRVTALFEVGPVHIEVSFIDDYSVPRSTILQFATRAETELWLQKLYTSVPKRTIAHTLSASTLDSIRAYLRVRKDYYEPALKAFRIVIQQQHAQTKPSHKGATSSDDLTKIANATTHAILVIGHYAVHLLAVDCKPPSMIASAHGEAQSQFTPLSSHGIVALVHLAMSPRASTLYLSFRAALSPVRSLELASCAAKDIIQSLRSSLEHLRPCWTEYPLTMDVPEYVQDEPLVSIPDPTPDLNDNNHSYGMNGFNMTLAAYCVAFGIPNAVDNIAHEVFWDEDNGLVFRLLPPKKVTGLTPTSYSVLELLCVMRALRWNEAFGGISLAGISLASLQDVTDHYAAIELDQTRTANSRRISKFMKVLPVLKLELQLLMLCSTALRMLDLSGCVRPPKYGQEISERASGVIDALMHVAKRATSNVDSFVFTNIQIDLYDFDFLVDVASSRAAHLRNIEIAHCGLYERELTLLLQALEVHENTLEGLDISENPGRISVYSLNESLYRFQYMRHLYMRKLLTTSEDLPLLSVDTLSNMRLQRLVLDGTRLRPISVKHLCDYLSTSRSASLVQFSIQSCGLTGNHVGDLLSAMGQSPAKQHPDLTVYVGDNPICTAGFDVFLSSITKLGTNVRRLSMPRIEFHKEQFLCDFFTVLASPKCKITHLDLSLLLIPDADASAHACDLLGNAFARNTSLMSFNLTGETSKLQVARIGHGIGRALERLSENSTLRELYIEGNELSVDGAMLLAQTLTRNRAIRRIHLDDNDVNLQGFTAIVNSIVESGNTVVRFISRPVIDQTKQLRNLRDLCGNLDVEIAVLKQQKRSSSSSDKDGRDKFPELTSKVEARKKAGETVKVLEMEWQRVYERLDKWLKRGSDASSATVAEEETEDQEKTRKAWERLRGTGRPGRKISAGGRVVK
ncbi:hypothetical protein POJ06DRAFT_224775 [Lipomyces tetrasporus]|uniref:LRR-containing protein second PH domain-containing protein n=1 Tax=Lipomyces tetrasporus TaxID=54092 RepID=A0AAD7VSP9_9ASCO|nr:uncharacterized protein POJ06DRAFT_224775 [Lipomyces tetrasporus]KAJ8099250.1 hypothetical protein POJ06DRAFT_224775 [Lipomyces tetrasporus]